MNNHDAIRNAETLQVEMQARLTAAREALAMNETRRHALAFAAETGDLEAKREAAALAKTAGNLEESIKHSLMPAVAEASQRVVAARQEADLAVKRQAAAQARIISARLAARGAQLDEGLLQAREAYVAFQNDLRELARLGAPAPSANLIEVNSRRALDTALAGFHSQIRPVQQSHRHSFDELLRGWARPSELWSAEILDTPVTVVRVVKEVA
jgi:hypothetical protein